MPDAALSGTTDTAALRSRARGRFQPEPRGGLVLEARDRRLLADLYWHGVMARGQLQALYFSSTPRCNFRLRQLYDHGLVRRHPWPGLRRAESSGVPMLYALGAAAIPAVATFLDIDLNVVRQVYRRTQTPLFLQHSLAVVDLRVALHRAATCDPDLELERWLSERQCRHEYDWRAPGGGWRHDVFKPDGFARLRRRSDATWHSYFVEADLGPSAAQKILYKLAGHQRYLESGLFYDLYEGDTFQTLLVTTTEGRLRNLLDFLEEEESRRCRLATFDAVREQGILAPIWWMPGHRVPAALL